MEKFVYEIIPPPKSWSQEKVESWTRELCQMLEKEGVGFISLPEVIEESRDGERVVSLIDKIDNLEFAALIKRISPTINPIPYKICVRVSEEDLLNWAGHAVFMGIEQIVLVGGERSSFFYPGPTVLQATTLIKAKYPELALGGITIFTRKGEAQRVFDKMQQGIEFFMSQIIFETENMKCVLLELEKRCNENLLKMPRIYLSLAPAESKVDIEFMQWLGVEFPSAVLSFFLDYEKEDIRERVFEVLEFTLEELTRFISKQPFDIGFNVEQIMYKSRDSAERLLKLVKKMVEHCQL